MDYRDWGRGELARPVRRPADAWVDDGDPRPGDPYSHTGEGHQPSSRRRGAHRSDPDRYTPGWVRGSADGEEDHDGRHHDGVEPDRPWADKPPYDPPRTEVTGTTGRDSGSPATDYWTAPSAWSSTEPGTGGRRRAESDDRRPGRAGRHADAADDRAEDDRAGRRQANGYAERGSRSGTTRRSETTWSGDGADPDGASSSRAPSSGGSSGGGSSGGGRRRADRDRSGDRPTDGRDERTGQWSAGSSDGTGRQWSRTGRPRWDERAVEPGRWDQFTDTGIWHWGSEDERPEPRESTPGPARADRTEPVSRAERRERTGRAARSTPENQDGRTSRSDRADGTGRAERGGRSDRTGRGERAGRGSRSERPEWAGPRTTAGTGEPVTRSRGYRSDPDDDRTSIGPTPDDRMAGGSAEVGRVPADPATGGRSRDRFAETGQWNRVTDTGERQSGRRHRADDTGQWDRLTDTGQWDRLDGTDRTGRFDDADRSTGRDDAEPRVWSSFTDTGQWDRFTDTGVWDRSELDALEQERQGGDGPSWRDRGEAFWSGTRLADDDPRWMETPTSAPRSPAVAYPRPPRVTPPSAPAPTTTGSRVASAPAEPRAGRGRRSGQNGRVAENGRAAPSVRTAPSSPPVRPGRRIEEDLLDAEPGTHLAAVLYTAAWYAVPVLVFFVWLVTLDNSSPPGCVTDPSGGGCDSDRAQALTSILGAAPRFGAALMGSLVVALLLRWVSKSWRPASLGLASAVVGGGLSTVLYSVITGQPLG